ncbi:sensor histidine kinase [Chitinophaga vietnamensis]|uniref:sensor histidine kinase n=1 Tax=Chitinophaga vietnamensis TaxID=2593957 RepID=UPI001375C4A0|nr:HAMP domain-containing sensor histidine kinase [Chitinophaga vietnamensis]
MLITLSLLGIIYIQVSWIKSALLVKKEQIEQRAVDVTASVQQYMLNRRQTAVQFRINTFRDASGKRMSFDITKAPYKPQISDLFTVTEVHHLISENLKRNHLDDKHFEFGIVGPSAIGYDAVWNMQTGGFGKLFEAITRDTAHQIPYQMKIIPLSESGYMGDNTSEQLFIIMPLNDNAIMRQMGYMITGGVLFTLIMITAFALTIRTMLNQKKLSEIKSDFINNMTHELKTPLATISLAIDAIGNEKVMDNKDKIRYFSGIIKEENKRMNKQVESILQSALLEKDEIGMKLQATDVHAVIQHTTENLQLQLAGKNGVVDLQLDAVNPVIMADDVHFSNVIFNLLDNAIKYSKDNLEVVIHTYNTRKSLFIVISDNGIGMSRDTISRIFEKFYRAHTGNVHNVKGFGLGLTYVKAIVDAHKGKIKVESTLGKGSKFTMEFPQE